MSQIQTKKEATQMTYNDPGDDAKRNPDAQIATTTCRNQRIYASKTQQLQTERRLKKTTLKEEVMQQLLQKAHLQDL